MKASRWNDQWKYWAEKDAFALVWNVPECANSIDLPHDAMIRNPVNPKSKNGKNAGFRDSDNYIYVKELYVPEEDRDQTVMLKFEGVYMNAFVYVNGQLAAKNRFGYTTFYVPLNDYLKYGEVNEIRVLVRSGAMANSRWYPGAGIYRDVYLLRGGMAYLVPEGVQIHTEHIVEKGAVIQVSTEIVNRGHSMEELVLETTILDQHQQSVSVTSVPLSLFQGEERRISQRLTLEGIDLWSDETPALYQCKTRLLRKGGELFDEDETTFGIRTIQVDAIHGFQVNGQTVNLRGACVHHDSGLLGAATYDQAQFRQIRKLKEAGFNAIRMAHHPMAPAMLRACDKLGMYVMDEAFDMWTRCKSDFDYGLSFDECWEKDITAMVRHDYNHPSVVMYSLGNEISEIGINQGLKTCYELNQKVKSLDSTRFTLTAINGLFVAGDRLNELVKDLMARFYPDREIEGNVNDFMALLGEHMEAIVKHNVITDALDRATALTDLAGYNYMQFRYEEDLKKNTNRIIVGSETCPPAIVDIWPLVEKNPQVIGDFSWTGWDYLGEAGVGIPEYEAMQENPDEVPAQTAYVGDLDLTGFRRPMSYLREIVYKRRTEPYIAVQNPHNYGKKVIPNPWVLSDAVATWTWNCMEGSPVVVEVYAPGTEVELFLNGKSIGKKAAGERSGYRTLFEVGYHPGTLEAVAYENGTVLGRTTLRSASPNGKRKLTIECEPSLQSELDTCNGELVYLNIALCDENLVTDTANDCKLHLTVEGNAVLLGFGSGNPKSRYAYTQADTETFQGRAMAILKKCSEEVDTKVTISSGTGLTASCFV